MITDLLLDDEPMTVLSSIVPLVDDDSMPTPILGGKRNAGSRGQKNPVNVLADLKRTQFARYVYTKGGQCVPSC